MMTDTTVEIERKFVVSLDNPEVLRLIENAPMRIDQHQGYLSDDPDRVVRVRCEIVISGETNHVPLCTLTVKGKVDGCMREEIELPISLSFFNKMIKLAKHSVRKCRYNVRANGNDWTIDVMLDPAIREIGIAEIELISPNQKIELPNWLGKEVTNELMYYQVNISKNNGCAEHR